MAIEGLFNFNTFQVIASPITQVLWVPILYAILGSISVFMSVWESGDKTLDEQTPLGGNDAFDFIIVGAGSSGSVLANRLSKTYSVLLLEAGGEPNPLQFIPAFGIFLVRYPEVDWRHLTVPQKYASLNSKNQQSSWSAGRGLGGTGNLNLLIHLRGHKLDFDNWARITGDPSWSWKGVLPYFKSYEDYGEEGNSQFHGYGGNLRIENPDYIGLGAEFVRAAGEMGYPNVDLNAEFDEGFDILKFPIKNGIREAPYRAFIEPIRDRKGLTIRKFSHVKKILFRDDNVAYGVEYDRHGQSIVSHSNKEVIISAGTITTPRILMLSGIGPAQHLAEHRIPVRVDLPVGIGLQDHNAVFLGPFIVNKERSTVVVDRDLTPGAIVQWFAGGRGILSSPGSSAAGFVASDYAKARGEGKWPDLILYYFGVAAFRNLASSLSFGFHLKTDEITKYFKPSVGKDSFLIAISGARPYSRGHIKLGGPSPYDAPVIDPKYCSDPHNIDIKALVDGVKKAVKLVENSTAFGKELGARFTQTILPGCENIPFRSDAYWECYARRFTITLHHPVGTCAMGKVVTTDLRVIGTKGLRVIDSSIQPEIVTSNTQASALMIGEKGADMVLNFWNNVEQQQFKNTVPINNINDNYFRDYSDKIVEYDNSSTTYPYIDNFYENSNTVY